MQPNGSYTDYDDPDQADMCELVRAAIKNGNFDRGSEQDSDKKVVTVMKPGNEFINLIDCPGEESVTEICAYNNKGFWDSASWKIVDFPLGLRVDTYPEYAETG